MDNANIIRAARVALFLLAMASFSGGLEAQSCSTFDVASIKPNTSGGGNSYPELSAGGRRLTATNQYMVAILMFAYDVSPLQISGIPAAISGERYDIEAACEQPMLKEQLPHMLQVLLAERFHLLIHRESKEQPVYALVLGKGGPKLHEAPQQGGQPSLKQSGHSFTFTNAEMSNLVGVLSQVAGRKVLDRTGLPGQYDFTLSYAPDRGAGREGPDALPAADSFPESVFTALREQLGLDLEPQKSQIDFIVVDLLDPLIPN